MNLLPYQIHVLLVHKIIFFMQKRQTVLSGAFSQMVAMKEFAAAIKMVSTGVKDAVQIRLENVLPIRLNVKESYEKIFLYFIANLIFG